MLDTREQRDVLTESSSDTTDSVAAMLAFSVVAAGVILPLVWLRERNVRRRVHAKKQVPPGDPVDSAALSKASDLLRRWAARMPIQTICYLAAMAMMVYTCKLLAESDYSVPAAEREGFPWVFAGWIATGLAFAAWGCVGGALELDPLLARWQRWAGLRAGRVWSKTAGAFLGLSILFFGMLIPAALVSASIHNVRLARICAALGEFQPSQRLERAAAAAEKSWSICWAATAIFYLFALTTFLQSNDMNFVMLLLAPLPAFYAYSTYHLMAALRAASDALARCDSAG